MGRKKIVVISALIGGILIGLIMGLIVILGAKSAAEKNEGFKNSDSSSEISSVIDTVVSEVTSEVASEPEIKDNGIRLVISSPTAKTVNTTEPTINFAGTSDPAEPLTVNGAEVVRGEGGIFSFAQNLNIGKNVFTFNHKGYTYNYTVNYRYVVIESYQPSAKQIYSSGSVFSVSVSARKGSTVTASFNGQTIKLLPKAEQLEGVVQTEVFENYSGSFTLPGGNYSDLDLGAVTYTATYNGVTESFKSGTITCKRPDFVVEYDPDATPLGGRYINVGSGKVTEIIDYQAETFDAYSTNDWSSPTNNYLPKGTKDYSAQGYVYYKNEKEYAVLRCGKQVYTSRKDKPGNEKVTVVKEYAEILPDHNEIELLSFENNGSHTVLTVNPMWKAPFYFDMLPQAYANPNKQDYQITNFTCNYIDITFCYATVLTGEIIVPEDNPLFSSAKIIKNQSDHTLRLFLKKQGAFYGWDANYNDAGQLVFEFLNPAKVSVAENSYGVDLTGVKVLIDVGHGGIDCGAPGFDYKNHSEAIENLRLAQKVKAELESIGATVTLTRTADTTSTTDDKITMLKKLKPDFCIAIHHNSSTSSRANGFDSYYSQPFSKKAAELVWMHTQNTGIYKKSGLGWHYYFVARCSFCPVVLTENGYISNQGDYANIINQAQGQKKAVAITKGIAEYFLGINSLK